MKKVVVIGGGTGTFTVLQGLKGYALDLTAIVSTADNGGSTGILRDELGVLPPGDIRQVLVALSAESSLLRKLLNYRFEEGSLDGHSFGNLFLSALEKVTGSFDQAVLEAGRILNIKGRVIPVTTDHMHLKAEMENGTVITGEHQIDDYIWSERAKVRKIWVEPACTLHPLAKQAIIEADLIVIAPGSVFTSIIPNFLVGGMVEALNTTRAALVYVSNLMTEKGHTGAFYVEDFADLISGYLGANSLDFVVYNTRMPASDLQGRYKKEMERIPVRLDRHKRPRPYRLIGTRLIARPLVSSPTNDRLAQQRTLIRHDSLKLADVLYAIAMWKDVKRYIA